MNNKEEFFFIAENINSGRRSSLNWVESSASTSWLNSEGLDTGFLSLSMSSKKIRFFFFIILAGILCLILRTAYLQIFRNDYYFGLAENNRIKTEYVKAHRGIIYDRNGKALVQNVFGFTLSMVPASLPKNDIDKKQVISEVSKITGVSLQEIEQKMTSTNPYYFQAVPIKTGIDYDKAMDIKIRASELPGVELDIDSWRKYLDGLSFAHILGYVGKINAEEYAKLTASYLLNDNIGKTGLEKQYENYLKGQHGQKKYEVDALGREKKIIYQVPFKAGDNLILSVDADLQDKIYQVLDGKLKGNFTASVIVSNPQSGEIMAMVDYPSYDNNLFARGITKNDYKALLENEQKPLFARSFLGEYPSGSTVKIVEAAGALQEGIITKNTTVNSSGGIRIGQWFFPDWKAGGHGSTNVVKAIAQSVNTFFYYIGGGYGDFKGMGVPLLDKYFLLFGLAEKTGIDLPSEAKGFVPTEAWKQETKKEQWYIGDTYHLSIGQGDLLVTPLQVNNYTSAIANGGKLYKPHLLHQINFYDGQFEIVKPEIIRQDFVHPGNINIIREGMRETIVSGSARSLSSLPVEVAGKTGTAQWNTTKPNHAWFTGFAPFNNPTFCITVLVEQGGEGSSIAVPIAHEIFDFWFVNGNPRHAI
ncbi:MAG: penicillin-binding protein 2 [Candidatus Buchananbacteria bacterium]